MLKCLRPLNSPTSLSPLQLRLYNTFWYVNILALLALVPYLLIDLFIAPYLWAFHALASVLLLCSQVLLHQGYLKVSQLMSLLTSLGIVTLAFLAFGGDSGMEYYYFPIMVAAAASSVWPVWRRIVLTAVIATLTLILMLPSFYAPWLALDPNILLGVRFYNMAMTSTMLVFIMFRARTLMELLGRDADIDPLTHTLNRRAFFLAARRLQRRRQRFALLLLDLDHFKSINDRFGHDVGDQALIHVAALMKQHTRRHRDALGRYGGEEFVLMLQGASKEHALRISQALCATIAETPFTYRGHTLAMTVSIGVSLSDESSDLDTVLSLADQRLYQAKSAGRNRAIM
ncbi:GGDEF domain-containing protein [Larsenimonas salina]|uniref:GGDEF domain-containing protein n=1 Tax=Larsenimonas salina TaxID=1295565 RepID=UPI002073B954|nr:GGDEF domain-containing protein [Larsenimonas salina]MCM5705044.1 diguanylate cyclase [Larsenimonas salina]